MVFKLSTDEKTITIDAAFYRNGKMEPTVYLHLCTQFLEGKDEKCPYCGQGMQRGYVAGDRSLPAWLIEHEDTMVFPVDTLGEFYLRDKVPKRILDKLFATEQAMNHKEGFICRNCGKIILDVKNIMT